MIVNFVVASVAPAYICTIVRALTVLFITPYVSIPVIYDWYL